MPKKIQYFCIILFIFLLQFNLIISQIAEVINFISDNQNYGTTYSLSHLSNIGGYINVDGIYYHQVSYVENQAGSDGTIIFPQISISNNCINKLKTGHDNEKIIIAKVFRREVKTLNSLAGINYLTNVMHYQFFYLNVGTNTVGSIINIQTSCQEKVVYYLPIYSDDTLKNKFVSVSGQNPSDDIEDLRDYDIFDPDAKIYNDICATLTFSIASENVYDQDSFENYDITLRQRRKYYFPGNTELCPKNFNYLGIDKTTFSALCEKDFTDYSGPTCEEHSDYTQFEVDEKDFKDSKKDIYFSMDVLKCIKLPFTKEGFKENYGSYFVIALFGIVLICFLILLLSGKYHLLSVLELLYNSNIKSMNYLKNVSQNNQNNPLINNSNQVVYPYDIKNNTNLGMSHQALTSNGQLLPNFIAGNNYLNYNNPNVNDKISISKKSNNNNLKKNEKEKEKKDLMSNVDEQENDFESEKGNEEKDKTNIYKDSYNDVNILNVKEKEKEKELDNNNNINNDNNDNNNKKDETLEKKEEKEKKEKEEKKSKKEEEEEEDEDDDDDEESESDKSYKNKINKKKEEEKEKENVLKNDEDKANPPKKVNKFNPPKKGSANGGQEEDEEENGEKKKKVKSKNPIEISLNVKDLRDMMFKDQLNKQSENIKEEPKEREKSEKKLRTKPKKKNNNYNNGNNINTPNYPPNGFPYPPYMPPMMPYGMPPPYPYMNNGSNTTQNINNEAQNLKRELEYQKELNDRRDREIRREREEMMDRERERQRQRDMELDRERRLREMEMMYGNKSMELGLERFEKIFKKKKRGSDLWNDDSEDLLRKERKKFYDEQDKFNRIKEKLEEEIEKKKEENKQIQRDLNLAKEENRLKQIEFEKELLKKDYEMKEKFEKEKNEIIEAKNREIQLIKEDKDREIQKLKEDRDRELNLIKSDMKAEIKKKDDKIKKKEKLLEKQKKETKELKKDLTTNTFYTNNPNYSTFRQINPEYNPVKKEEKIDSPQVVISINSIFTDQELNAMDFDELCQFDKRSLSQVYLSFINRKQPLFFWFNYNTSSSGISVFQINFQSIRFIIICLDFMIYMFIYCSFFGTKSISHIYKKDYNFRRMCILGSIISPFCLIIRSIIHHFVYDYMNKKIAEIKIRCYTNFVVGKKKEEIKVNEFREFWDSDGGEEVKNKDKDELNKKEELDDIQEIENDENLSEEEKIRRKDKYEKRRLKLLIKEVISLFQKKLLISFCVLIVVIFFLWLYISCFCAVYKNSQSKFFLSLLVCYGFANLRPGVYCLVPTLFIQDAARDESRLSFLLAKVFQII